MAPHSSTLAWKIPWTEEPGRLHSVESLKSQTRLSNFTFTFHFYALEKAMATHPSVLAWRLPGTGEPGGLPSMGSPRVGHDWSDIAAAAACSQLFIYVYAQGLPPWLSSKESAFNAEDTASIPRSGRFPGQGRGNPLQYSCMENSMGKGA